MPEFALICMMVAAQTSVCRCLAETWVALEFRSSVIIINKSVVVLQIKIGMFI